MEDQPAPPVYSPGPPELERRARENVQLRLTILSTIIWFLVTFSSAVILGIPLSDFPARAIPLGFAMLLVAALPWLAFRTLARRELARLQAVAQRRAARSRAQRGV